MSLFPHLEHGMIPAARPVLLIARNRESTDTLRMRTGHAGLCNKHEVTNNQLCIYDCIL